MYWNLLIVEVFFLGENGVDNMILVVDKHDKPKIIIDLCCGLCTLLLRVSMVRQRSVGILTIDRLGFSNSDSL